MLIGTVVMDPSPGQQRAKGSGIGRGGAEDQKSFEDQEEGTWKGYEGSVKLRMKVVYLGNER